MAVTSAFQLEWLRVKITTVEHWGQGDQSPRDDNCGSSGVFWECKNLTVLIRGLRFIPERL